jgi:hypothetical protein
MCVKRTWKYGESGSHSAPKFQHYMPMENGATNAATLKPITSQLLWILFFRKRIMWLAPHSISIWLDLRTPNLLQSKTLNTKSRQGTGTLTSPTAETGQQLRILAFSSQRSGFWSLASRPSRLDPQFRSAWKRCSFDLARSRALFCAASFVIAGQGPPPTSKFWMDLKLSSSTLWAGQLNLDRDFIWRATVIRTNQMPPAT